MTIDIDLSVEDYADWLGEDAQCYNIWSMTDEERSQRSNEALISAVSDQCDSRETAEEIVKKSTQYERRQARRVAIADDLDADYLDREAAALLAIVDTS